MTQEDALSVEALRYKLIRAQAPYEAPHLHGTRDTVDALVALVRAEGQAKMWESTERADLADEEFLAQGAKLVEAEARIATLEAKNTRLWARLGELTADTEEQKP